MEYTIYKDTEARVVAVRLLLRRKVGGHIVNRMKRKTGNSGDVCKLDVEVLE